jgi:hypothetical protein
MTADVRRRRDDPMMKRIRTRCENRVTRLAYRAVTHSRSVIALLCTAGSRPGNHAMGM